MASQAKAKRSEIYVSVERSISQIKLRCLRYWGFIACFSARMGTTGDADHKLEPKIASINRRFLHF